MESKLAHFQSDVVSLHFPVIQFLFYELGTKSARQQRDYLFNTQLIATVVEVL